MPATGWLRLRDIGPRSLADFEPVLGGADLLAQELDVLGRQVDHDLGADDVHECGNGIEQDLLLDQLELFARRLDRVSAIFTEFLVRKPRNIGCSTDSVTPRGLVAVDQSVRKRPGGLEAIVAGNANRGR